MVNLRSHQPSGWVVYTLELLWGVEPHTIPNGEQQGWPVLAHPPWLQRFTRMGRLRAPHPLVMW